MTNSTVPTGASEHKIPARKNIFEACYNCLAAIITPAFLRASCTPNQITIVSGLFGVAGAILLVVSDYRALILAAVCIQVFAILDLVDGNIARAKSMQTKFGHWLDIFFDKLNDFLLIVGLTAGAYRTTRQTHVFIMGMVLMGLMFYVQFLMLLSSTILRKVSERESPPQANILFEAKGPAGGSVLKQLIKSTLLHATLGHSAFLLFLSAFALTNCLHGGLLFLTAHALFTLSLMILVTFYRLWGT